MKELNICTLFMLSNQPTTQPAYQPKSEKMCMSLAMESLNVRTQHMLVIYLHLSMLTGKTKLPDQPTSLKTKKLA